MAVPALTTSDIATFAYFRQTGCTYVQLGDVLPILHSYVQHAEYVDGTIKIFDTGGESGSPNNYVLVNVRIRVDGWLMAWFPRTLMTGTADSGSGVVVTDSNMQIRLNGYTSAKSVAADELAGYIFKPTSGPLAGNEYCIKSNTTTTITLHARYGDNVSTDMETLEAATYDIIQSRGNIVWWGHCSSTHGTAQSTRPGRALYEMWEQLKTNNQGGSTASLDYNDVGYWDYEYPSATQMYIFGYSIYDSGDVRYHCTVPEGTTLYSGILSYGAYADNSALYGYVESILRYSCDLHESTEGFVSIDMTSLFSSDYGRQKTMRHDSPAIVNSNQVIVLLTSG